MAKSQSPSDDQGKNLPAVQWRNLTPDQQINLMTRYRKATIDDQTANEIIAKDGPAAYAEIGQGELTMAPTKSSLPLANANHFRLFTDPEAKAAMEFNLQTERLREVDLTKIKVPPQGMLFWQIPTAGRVKSEETFEGIIVNATARRAYWESTVVSNNPPDCFSNDCVNGIGNPGGPCDGCPHNEFGTALRPDGTFGAGKRCGEKRVLFILREEDIMPILLWAPATSLKGYREYIIRLGADPVYSVITRFGLRADKSKDGTAYTAVTFEAIGRCPPSTGAKLMEHAGWLRSILANNRATREDYVGQQ